jgi:hypothetical protein
MIIDMLAVMAARKTPPALSGRPFLRDEAIRLGVTPGQLRTRFRRIFHRVYVGAEVPDSLELRCRAALLIAPPMAVFCGVTAARLYDVPLLDSELGIHVAVPSDMATVPQVSGLVVHQYALRPAQFREVRGFRVVRPEPLFLELAVTIERIDLIIAGDHLLGNGWTDLSSLTHEIDGAMERPGIISAREALPQLEPRSRSPMETRLRLLIVDAGLPQPVANANVHAPDGSWIGSPDLAYLKQKIAIDYEGDHHRTDRRQYGNDLTRDRLYLMNGWLHLKYDAGMVYRGAHQIIADLRAAFAERGVPSLARPQPEASSLDPPLPPWLER